MNFVNYHLKAVFKNDLLKWSFGNAVHTNVEQAFALIRSQNLALDEMETY